MLLVAAVGAMLGWSAREVLFPVDDSAVADESTLVTVSEGTVGSSLSLNVTARWSSTPAGVNLASGIVTTVDVADGAAVEAGTELYSVDLRPVVVGEGDIPLFGSLAPGDRGVLVKQVQRLLSTLGIYSGRIDGDFDAEVASAVETWQSELGVEPDGRVQAGDIVFVTSLPARVALDVDAVRVGAQLSGGEQVLSLLNSAPTFTLEVTGAQAALMPSGTTVSITSPTGTTWNAVAGEQTQSDDGSDTVSVALSGGDGGSICGSECAAIQFSGTTLLPSEVTLVPTQEGLVVPAAALATDAAGDEIVIDEAGRRHRITVVASAEGMSVIHGADVVEGMVVQIPASDG
ncbi:MAG: peptidoglycan-binding domain-containing protein [Microbacteriaceae bacterium]